MSHCDQETVKKHLCSSKKVVPEHILSQKALTMTDSYVYKCTCPVEPPWNEIFWKRHLKCWKTGVGRSHHCGVCQHTTRMAVRYRMSYSSLCLPLVKPMPERLTYDRFCWQLLISKYTLVKGYSMMEFV